MRRERKHRAWHIESEKMIYDSSANIFKWISEGQPIEVMDHSGLKDKNGVEIYESDIVVVYDMEPIVIEYKNGGFGYNALFVKDDFIGICGHNHREWLLEGMKVIGNIYENPELLNKAEE